MLARLGRLLCMGPCKLMLCFRIIQHTCNQIPHHPQQRIHHPWLGLVGWNVAHMKLSASYCKPCVDSSCIISRKPLRGHDCCRKHKSTHIAVVCPSRDWRTMHGLLGSIVECERSLRHSQPSPNPVRQGVCLSFEQWWSKMRPMSKELIQYFWIPFWYKLINSLLSQTEN